MLPFHPVFHTTYRLRRKAYHVGTRHYGIKQTISRGLPRNCRKSEIFSQLSRLISCTSLSEDVAPCQEVQKRTEKAGLARSWQASDSPGRIDQGQHGAQDMLRQPWPGLHNPGQEGVNADLRKQSGKLSIALAASALWGNKFRFFPFLTVDQDVAGSSPVTHPFTNRYQFLPLVLSACASRAQAGRFRVVDFPSVPVAARLLGGRPVRGQVEGLRLPRIGTFPSF